MTAIAHPSESIWLPSAGELRFDELNVARAVEEYDPELTLGQDRSSGQWAVFLPTPDGESKFPVFGFGHELPSPERAKELLYRADVRRNGRQILADIERTKDDFDREMEVKADEGREAVAEVIASHMNAEGTHPYPTIHLGGRGQKNGKERVRSG